MSTALMLRRQVGRELESMREAAGLPLTDSEAAAIVGSTRTNQRLERGERTNLTFPVIGSLCDHYGASAQKKYELQRMWRLVNEKIWAQPSHAVASSGFDAYLEFEQIASRFYIFATMYVPGLFQNKEYMRRLFQQSLRDPDEIPGLIQQRLERQEPFQLRDPAPTMQVLLSEAVLRNGCGDEQLARLIEEDARENISISYLPFEGGPYPLLDTPFDVLSFRHDEDPSIVYLESPYERRFYEMEDAVQRYLRVFEAGLRYAKSIKEFRHEPGRLAQIQQKQR